MSVSLDDLTHVLAHFPSDGAPHIWNCYRSEEAAKNAIAGAPQQTPWVVMPFNEYLDRHTAHYTSGSLIEISQEKFDEMLGVLPPLWWGFHDGNEAFLMSEFTAGSCTEMYAKVNGKCYCKTVNAKDTNTWITTEMVNSRIAVKVPEQPA